MPEIIGSATKMYNQKRQRPSGKGHWRKWLGDCPYGLTAAVAAGLPGRG
jgi:hypothetical protein